VGYTVEVGWAIEAPVPVAKKFSGYDEYSEYAGAATSRFPVDTSYSGPISEVYAHSSSK
jgi:hypothetical protein